MLFTIRHSTRYTYDRPVFLEPLEVRLHPRTDAAQALRAFELSLEPAPAGQATLLDPEGNVVRRAWFDGTRDSLLVSMEARVETLRTNPFDYLPEPGAEGLPVAYGDELRARLAPCFAGPPPHPAVAALAERLAAETGSRTLAYLDAVNRRLYTGIEAVVRPEGGPLAPQETLRRGSASCRDSAVLFMALCRAAGLAARFVSGYQEGDGADAGHELHAWAEVYIPGGGWRGYDPMHGLAVSDRHIAVAASVEPQATLPLAGTFRGTGARQAMATTVRVAPD